MRRVVVALAATGSLLAVAPGCHKNTVTTPVMSATCDAQPASGIAPLAVRFLLTVAGAEGPFTVTVSYGDGASGTNPDVLHTYSNAGSYTASFAVETKTQSARCAALVTVSAPKPTPPPNEPPNPSFRTSPPARNDTVTGTAPFKVGFNMCLTSDPEHDWLFFSMDFEGDGKWDVHGPFGGNCRADHTYAAGSYKAVLCVHDINKTRGPLHPDQCRTFTVNATP